MASTTHTAKPITIDLRKYKVKIIDVFEDEKKIPECRITLGKRKSKT